MTTSTRPMVAQRPAETTETQPYPEIVLLIDGERIGAYARETLDVINPATGRAIGKVPCATREDLDRALAAAKRGFAVWRRVSAFDRARILRRAADLVRERVERIARTLTLEEGKAITDARGEIVHAAEIIEWSGEEGRRAYGRVVPARRSDLQQTVYQEPIGPVAAFAPWNFPAVTPARKLGGALGAGCSIILKPAEETPGTALAFVEALIEAGVPSGAVNLVFGHAPMISEHLIASPLIRKISFTGSTRVGKHLAALAAAGVKKATLELGGHAAVIVCDDIPDVKAAAQLSLSAKTRNAGQVCASPTRFFVQQGVYEEFLAHFIAAAKALRIGDGLDERTEMGPLANARRLTAMQHFVDDSRACGATVTHTQTFDASQGGFFFAPAIVTDIPPAAEIMREEPFGPVVPIVPFEDLDQALDRANELPYGLTAYALTTRVDRAHQIGTGLEAGVIGINHFAIASPEIPFGGVKESGYGSESGPEGVAAYFVPKMVSMRDY